jgi:N-acetylneuraminate lyase
MAELSGVIPAMFTAFDDDGEVSPERLRRVIAAILEQGVQGLFVCGSTGEGILMSPEERERVAEITVAEVAHQVPVMVHVGAAATRDSLRLARHAARIGADAVSSIPPFYYNPGMEGILDHYRLLGEATDLPLYIYYIPHLTGSVLDPSRLEELLAIPNLAGLKFTDTNLFLMRNLIDLSGGRLRILSGPDEMHLPCLTMGAVGAIGTSYNYMARPFLRLRAAYQRGDLETAQELQYRSNAIIRALLQYGGLPAAKEIMRRIGANPGPARRPFRPLTEEQRRGLHAALDAAGFEELIA